MKMRCGICKRLKRFPGCCYSCGAFCFEAATEKYQRLSDCVSPEFLKVGACPLGDLLGGWADGLAAIVRGPPAQGKTSLCCLAAGAFAEGNFPTVWLSREMGGGLLKNYFERLGVKPDSVSIFNNEELALEATEELGGLFVVDSLQQFSREVLTASARFRLFVARELKDETEAGSSHDPYDVDAVVRCADGIARLEKCRWKKSSESIALSF